MASYSDTLRELANHNQNKQWLELRTAAERAAAWFPESADVAAYAAHALRQLGELELGYTWATRARSLDPTNLFAINRVSLLANLTSRYEEAYVAADAVLEREPLTAGEAQNIAVTIVNSIYAASRLGRTAEAARRFTPAIERLDHDELHFNSACLYALAGDHRSLDYVYKSLVSGKPKAAFLDSDFDAVRTDPRFVRLLARDWDAEAAALQRASLDSRAALRPEHFVGDLAVGEPNLERHVELERMIDANIDDIEGYLVYSDWLQGQSNPRGHFILASKRCHDARTEDERMLAYVDWAVRLREHAGALLGSYAAHHGATTWHMGFISKLVFDLGYRHGPDPGTLLAKTFALPVCRFVRALAIGDVPADETDEAMDYASVVEALCAERLPHLRTLQIAPVNFQMSWTHLDVSSLALPALESLVIGAGNLVLGTLELPKLRRFAIRTGGLSRDNLEAILAAHWPDLEDLEIWFGSSDLGATEVTARDISRICRRSVRRLALMNAEFTDEIIDTVVRESALQRLETLDLAMGTLTDAGAATMISNRQYLAHLAHISVRDNCLSDEVATALQLALPQTHIGKQKAGRYVSVGE